MMPKPRHKIAYNHRQRLLPTLKRTHGSAWHKEHNQYLQHSDYYSQREQQDEHPAKLPGSTPHARDESNIRAVCGGYASKQLFPYEQARPSTRVQFPPPPHWSTSVSAVWTCRPPASPPSHEGDANKGSGLVRRIFGRIEGFQESFLVGNASSEEHARGRHIRHQTERVTKENLPRVSRQGGPRSQGDILGLWQDERQ